MRKILVVIFYAFSIMACKEEYVYTTSLINHIENKISLRLQSPDGIDLLNHKNEGHYRDSEIKIPETGNTASVKQSLDYYYLTLKLNNPKPDINKGELYDEEVTTKLNFGNNEPDTIKALYEIKYRKGSNEKLNATASGFNVILQQAWFNGVEVYEIQAAENKDWEYPIVVKEPQKRE